MEWLSENWVLVLFAGAMMAMPVIESFLYGAYAGLVYVPMCNFMHRKWVK